MDYSCRQVLGHCERCGLDRLFFRVGDPDLGDEVSWDCPICKFRYLDEEPPEPRYTRIAVAGKKKKH